MKTTSGTWIVSPFVKKPEYLCVLAFEQKKVLAILPPLEDGQPNFADAAIMAASKEMLDTLIAIQESLMTSKKVIDLEAINQLISATFEKIAAESGEI